MHLNAMDVRTRDDARTIELHINMLTPSALEQVKVVHLLEMRFGAVQGRIGRFFRAPGKPFGLIELRLPDAATYQDAKRYCAAMLTRSGMMIPRERAVLDEEGATGRAGLLFWKLQALPVLERADRSAA